MTDNGHDNCWGAITVDTLSKTRPVLTILVKRIREHSEMYY